MDHTIEAPDNLLRQSVGQLAGDPQLVEAAQHLLAGRLGKAEPLCRSVLKRDPTNVNAICMLADIGIRVGALKDADALLRRCLDLKPDFIRARILLATACLKRQQFAEALDELDKLDQSNASAPDHSLLRANIFSQTGRHSEAVEIYRQVASARPGNAGVHMSLAHALKTIGRQAEAIENYKRAAELQPSLGDAYWSLANLKTYRFEDAQIAAMKELAASEDIGREDFFHLCFALGKALEDRKDYDQAFWYYQRGNVVRRGFLKYDGDHIDEQAAAQKRFFSKPRQGARKDSQTASTPIPIFIVGLPRAGSTLIEQILASHSQVEGTQELPDIISIARRLAGTNPKEATTRYPAALGNMSAEELAGLGREYLDRTAPHRSGAPYFIDKMPNNFMHVGMIREILPNAIIIDARRNPMDCCLSGYKQLFARGQNFSYSLTEIGRYYATYVDLMRHWDEVFPGQIIRVYNEDVVSNAEHEIRRLLVACGLPFEEACVNFHKTKRAVKTASSEQVREPVNAKGVGRWKNYERHLGPLVEALGSALKHYRD